jgi:GDSL-like Lipase/Acylhydrolase
MKTIQYLLLSALTGILLLTATGNGPATRPPVPKRAPALLYIALLPPPSGPLLSQVPALPSSGVADRPVRDVAALLNQLPAVGVVDLGSLKPASGTQTRYVAVGGSLTAGFRNGGLYREAQLTTYPNLIARQMGLTDFRQPLFTAEQGNGAGYKQLQAGSATQYSDVTNNVAITGTNPLTFSPVSGRVDNLGMPFLGIHSAQSTESWRLNSQTGPGVPYELTYRSYFRRLLPNDDTQWLTNYLAYVLEQKADFMTIELGMDDAIWFATAGGYRLNGVMTQLAMGEGSPVIALLNHLAKNQIKGAIATVPDVLRFPYFSFVPVKTARQRNGGQKLYAVVDDRYELVETDNQPQYVAQIADTDILLPTTDGMSLSQGNSKKGLSKTAPLSSHDVLSAQEIADLRHVDDLNSLIRFQATKAKVPVVDLASLYKRIPAGQYITDDGLKIDPSFPGGNFFSGDGLHPSALGQAVLANEWIRAINGYYGTRIPLIATTTFAQRLNE